MTENSSRRDELDAAITLHRSGNLHAALEAYRRYLNSAPNHLEICNLAADAAFGLKNFETASELLQRVANAQPQNPKAQFNYGVVLKELGRLEAAVKAFRQATRLQPGYATAQFQLGLALTGLGRREAAVKAFQSAILLEPGNVEALSNCAVLLKELGRLNEALALYRRAIAIQPQHAGLNYNFGLALEATERFEEAANAFRRAVDLDPNLILARSSLARCLSRLGRHDEAIGHYRAALTLAPSSAELETRLGQALQASGAFDEAIAAHLRAVDLEPNSEGCFCALGESLTAAGRCDEAIEAFDHALALRPDYHEAISMKGLALEGLNRSGEIIVDLQTALKQQPDATEVGMSLARALLQDGDAQGALDVCDHCLARQPGLTTALAYRALALRELERNEEARALVDLERLLMPLVIDRPSGYQTMKAFNEALAHHILAHPTLMRDPPGHATMSGRHTGELLIDPKGPVADLEEVIKAAVARYMKAHPRAHAHPFLARQPKRWMLNVWSVVLEAQGHQIPHIHPSAWLSGVYYVKIPEIVARSGNSHAGWIEFGQPSANLNCTAPPELRYVQPEEGLMVLFPAYFYHRTQPFDTEGTRISVAFDILPFGEN